MVFKKQNLQMMPKVIPVILCIYTYKLDLIQGFPVLSWLSLAIIDI